MKNIVAANRACLSINFHHGSEWMQIACEINSNAGKRSPDCNGREKI
ncbi:MAG: hypothetical protein ABF326_10440 [Arenicellales bacterium]